MARIAFVLAWFAGMAASAQPAAQPFKLGTFERDGRAFVGVVLGEKVVDYAFGRALSRLCKPRQARATAKTIAYLQAALKSSGSVSSVW